MRKGVALAGLIMMFVCGKILAQSVHLSQFFNAPMLITPANTALMPDNDFRLGLNYRNQWSALPVPYNTISAWGDVKIGGNKDNGHNNWLGLGLALYSDKAGDGDLKLNQFQGSLAYHLTLSENAMVSLGLSAASVSRSVNYDKLIFDQQWTGMSFNSSLPNGEKVGIMRASYYTVGAGINFAYFPNENVYVKLGGGAVNINKPLESFYAGSKKNEIALRPSATLDVLIRSGPILILNPSVYYTTQSGAMELVTGTQIRTVLSGGKDNTAVQLIVGGFYRFADAAIGVLGLQYGPVQFTFNYDFTLSTLSPYNNSYGALEFSLIYVGNYNRNKGGLKRSYSCPRFN